MHAEVISMGDELTSGQSLDTNAQWISRRLGQLGIWVLYHTTVGDQLAAIVDVFRAAIDRSDVVVTTGGLGPTEDDLTRQALAATLDRPLVCDETALDHIRCLFARRGRQMPERNRLQALLPTGARLVPNPHGTAPGIAVEVARDERPAAYVYCLPGVPTEMRQMWDQTVAPELRRLGGAHRIIHSRRLKCFGAGESAVEAMLPGLTERGRLPRVGITASRATITLTVTAEAATEAECCQVMEPTLATIRQCLGNLVFGEDDDELEDAVVQILRRQRKTLATAEWATGGLLVDWLRSAAGDGPEIAGGLVAANPTTLAGLVDLSAEFLRPKPNRDRQGAAENPTGEAAWVETLAQATRRKFATDYALAVGPFPPDTPAAETPQPVTFALATSKQVRSQNLPLASHPALRKVFCAKTALNLLRLELLAQ